uniref:Uncharacterized protein n=1 Tax=Chloropicon roscoffensis TaxID=1461544 RepID=A0A7S2X385_9CHLO
MRVQWREGVVRREELHAFSPLEYILKMKNRGIASNPFSPELLHTPPFRGCGIVQGEARHTPPPGTSSRHALSLRLRPQMSSMEKNLPSWSSRSSSCSSESS